MPNAVINCPHCGARELTMSVFGTRMPPAELIRPGVWGTAAAICGRCGRPIPLILTPKTRENSSYTAVASLLSQWASTTDLPERHQLDTTVVQVATGTADIPDHLSEPVARAYRQGESNFFSEDSDEAAAAMYRRTVELVIKELFPEIKGDLLDRIQKMVKDGALPAAMGDWAHQVRIVGNDSVHSLDGVSRPDVEAARGFTDAFLRYLVTLPKQVELRRK